MPGWRPGRMTCVCQRSGSLAWRCGSIAGSMAARASLAAPSCAQMRTSRAGGRDTSIRVRGESVAQAGAWMGRRAAIRDPAPVCPRGGREGVGQGRPVSAPP
eukprot:2925643-Alexandrium_andersonii.AAC.1